MASLLSTVNLTGTQMVILKMIKKEQKSDKNMLKFLEDPTNYVYVFYFIYILFLKKLYRIYYSKLPKIKVTI